MTCFTKNAIQAAFWKLLTEKSYEKITVTDVVKACGINRNTFYYHYENIPEMADECIRGRLFEIVRQNVDDSLEKCLTGICRDLLENKEQFMNIYHAADRRRPDHFLFTLAVFATERYAEKIIPEPLPEDWECCKDYVKNAMIGVYSRWLNNDMRGDYEVMVKRFCMITDHLLYRFPDNSCVHDRVCTQSHANV